MSGMGHKQKSRPALPASAPPLEADVEVAAFDVCYGPEADVLTTDEAQRFVDRPSLPLIDELVRRH